MIKDNRRNLQRVRSIFVGDVHLGYKHARAEAFLDFLQQHQPDYVYLVGDFIDGWRLKQNWHWQPEYNQIFRRLIDLSRQGTRLRYTPGNHDAFLRHFLQDFGLVEVADQFIHRAADQRRYLVLHGDQFDEVELKGEWLSIVGSLAYDVLVHVDLQMNRLRHRLGRQAYFYSAQVKSRVKRAVQFVSRFEHRLIQHALAASCDGVICGHIHTPMVTRHEGVTYCNTGDWVENCSALVEDADGRMEIVHFAPHARSRAPEHQPAMTCAEAEAAVPQITAA